MEIANSTASQTVKAQDQAGSASVISSDFETFLKMLTAQMANQDPLNPMDSADYAAQLATFSSVEQQVLTNDLLQAMALQLGSSGMAEMAAWVGKEARAAAPAFFDGSPVTVAPNPASIADTVELVVRNAAGEDVQTLTIPVSAEPVEWAGVSSDGTPFPLGLYTFEVRSIAGGEVLMQEQAEVYSTVQEVRAEGGETILMLEGGVAVSALSVSALRDPAFF